MSGELALIDRVSEDTARARLERLLYASVGSAALVYGVRALPWRGRNRGPDAAT